MNTTLMFREIEECPAAAARLISAEAQLIQPIATILRARRFPFVVVCGRGSSGHVGVFLRYLIESHIGCAVSASAPSLVTSYRTPVSLDGALFIVVSQSGRSPDLIEATRAARSAGALTLAIVNDASSPVAEAADLVLPIMAGPEHAVAATKSVVNSLVACILLVAQWADDQKLLAAVARVPARLDAALYLDWSTWIDRLDDSTAAFITGRGVGLGTSREVALKISETLGIPAIAYSSAELRHGPRAAVTASTPVLALRQADEVAPGVDTLISDLRRDGLAVDACGGPLGNLPWIGDDKPACDALVMLIPAYRAIEREAVRRGRNPDAPAFLSKITETL